MKQDLRAQQRRTGLRSSNSSAPSSNAPLTALTESASPAMLSTESAASTRISIRHLVRSDVPVLKSILDRTGVFRDEEISVALELMAAFLDNPVQKDYDIYCAVSDTDIALGYVCFGPVPVSVGTYDLYWIAVDPDRPRMGLGRLLQQHLESVVRKSGGRLVIAETSSLPKYEK